MAHRRWVIALFLVLAGGVVESQDPAAPPSEPRHPAPATAPAPLVPVGDESSEQPGHPASDAKRAMEIQFKLMPVHKHLFVEANPIPVKWAMARMGLMGGALRLPMTPLSAANEAVVEQALRAAGLLA